MWKINLECFQIQSEGDLVGKRVMFNIIEYFKEYNYLKVIQNYYQVFFYLREK